MDLIISYTYMRLVPLKCADMLFKSKTCKLNMQSLLRMQGLAVGHDPTAPRAPLPADVDIVISLVVFHPAPEDFKR